MQHRVLSAGVVIAHGQPAGRRYLLLRAYQYWDFPKGMVEQGEQPLDAAIREVEEETTLNDLHFAWGHDYFETGPYNRGKVARYYIAETETDGVNLPINPELGRPEHDEFRWLQYDDAYTILPARVKPVIQWASRIIESGSMHS